MLRILLGLVYVLVASIGFSLFASLVICFGANPEARSVSDAAVPLLGIFTGAGIASRKGSWRFGLLIGIFYVSAWFVFWMYVMGRWDPTLWVEEGIPRLTVFHFLWWGLAILASALGGWAGILALRSFVVVEVLACLFLAILMSAVRSDDSAETGQNKAFPGFHIERIGPLTDQTEIYELRFDFTQQNQFQIGLYDSDSDDAQARDDSNTSYMGQSLEGLVTKLNRRPDRDGRQLVCAINGGFFGASGFAVAHHEELIVQEGVPFYHVDLLRPKEQACLFAVNSSLNAALGLPRFSILPPDSWDKIRSYETVLGGVRPLRVDGNSIPLEPGAGATMLKCSRTSVGWSADGDQFYILVVYDPESEGASQMQRRMHWPHVGGWDVREVQAFWEQKGVPFALLFDGGESTQLAYRKSDGDYRYISSGYQYSYTVGYQFQRPLLLTLPILPPSEAHRGVLNYLTIDGPVADERQAMH